MIGEGGGKDDRGGWRMVGKVEDDRGGWREGW